MPSDAGERTSQLELRDYLRVFRRRKGTITLCALVVVAAALVASFLQTPVYEGTAEVLLQARSNESLFDPNTGQPTDRARVVDTEIKVLKGETVRDGVRKELGTAPPVSAASSGATDVVEVRSQSTDPKQAAR